MKKPFTIEDYFRIQAVDSPQISPDGRRVAYVIRTSDKKENRELANIHLVDVNSGESFRLTAGPKHDHSPRWSPDGKQIAFVSDRKEKPQIWLIRPDGGEAEVLTDSKSGVQGLAWSPDGKRIAYRAADAPSKDEEEKKKKKDDARVADRDLKMSHLWVIDLAEKKAKRLTRGRYHVTEFAWSPDGKRIACAFSPTPLADDGWKADIAVVPATGGRRTALVRQPGFNGSPRWSPDGKQIAFVSQGGVDDRLAVQQIWLVPARGGKARNLTPKEEDLQGGLTWSPDGRSGYYTVGRGVATQVHRLSVSSGRTEPAVAGEDVVGGFSLSKDGKAAAFVLQNGKTPPQVCVSALPRGVPRPVTHINPHLTQYRLGRKETVRWTSDDGLEIEGLLIKPVGYRRGKRYPLLVSVHGGPTGAFLNTFDPGPPRPYPLAVFAERGYAVLLPNPRGSVNYGDAFKRANYRDWGGGDYRDIMTGVDAMISRGIADPDRLGMMGWSYGGYMTAWAVTQTDRFEAVSVGAGVANLYSMYGSNDISGYLLAFFGAVPWRDPEEYARHSALTFVDQVKSPVLIQHGERDVRVPFTQALEFHQALKDRKIQTELVIYPRQGHGLGEPRLVMDAMQRNLDWFDRWVLGKKKRRKKSKK